MVANFLDNIPNAALASILSFMAPFNWCVLAKRFSIEPYSAKNFFAVFSPTPGSPGILSAASPIIPRKSITCSGLSISNLAKTSGIPHISMSFPIRAGLYMKIFSETNCAKSLSGVTIKTLKFSFSACLAKVPIKSSASNPAFSMIGMCIAFNNS